MARCRRKRQAAPPSSLALALCIVAGVSLFVPRLAGATNVLLPVLFILSLLLIASVLWLVARTEKQRRAKTRALQLADVDHMSGVEFERYIGNILTTNGYHVSYTATTGDQGVDLLAKKARRTYAIQAKRYTGAVGNHAIMEANAGKLHYKAQQAIVVTTSSFTKHARDLAASTDTILIDRDKLAQWVLAYQNPYDQGLREQVLLDG